MRAAAAILLFAVVCLTASSLAWLRATSMVEVLPSNVTGDAVLAELETAHPPEVVVDLEARYAGRLDLLDPRLALPTWHKHARDEAVLVHAATRSCPPGPASELHDASLAKAYAWHEKTCAGAMPGGDAIAGPPFLHPSGKSYAALAHARGSSSPERMPTRSHVRFFHVLELGALDPSSLDAEDRALGAIPALAWESLTRGDRIVLTPSALLIAERGPLGLTKVKVHARPAWESFSTSRPLALVPRAPSGLCARPASPELCWEPRSAALLERAHPRALFFGTGASAALALGASLALVLAYAGERRRIHGDRIHVLRTLTHELRTPATSLRLDIEPLRAAYDELPESCQEPVLRISDGIERLHRVLHRSARYMALFETKAKADSLVQPRPVPSAQAMFEELSEEWPDGVSLSAKSADGPVRVDPEWLSVAVRNLVENGARHGKSPVAVTWALDDRELVIRVADGGTSAKLSLRHAVAPYHRDDASPGLGLGLAIVDRVARLCGGRLSHEPSPTVFELRIPAQAARARHGSEAS